MRKQLEAFCRKNGLVYYPDRLKIMEGEDIYLRTKGKNDKIALSAKGEPTKIQELLTSYGENAIINTKTSTGIKVSMLSYHTKERAKERSVEDDAIIEALKNPLNVLDIKIDENGKPSQRFIGEHATVNINPETGTIITVWKTGKKTVKKYKGDKT